VRDERLVHDLNIGGKHEVVTSEQKVPLGACTLGFRIRRSMQQDADPNGIGTLTINGIDVGTLHTNRMFKLMISWSGLDVGFDRGTTVSDYDGTGRFIGPYRFTGELSRVDVKLLDDQQLDQEGAARVTLARE